jgi:maleate isomerase
MLPAAGGEWCVAAEGSIAGKLAVRLGVILPDDVPVGYEWLEPVGLPPGIALSVRRSASGGGHAIADLLRTGELARLEPLAAELGRDGAASIVWACTSGSFAGGLQWARDQAESLSAAAGRPATSTTLAMIAVARANGFDEVDLLASYPRSATEILVACLEQEGIGVRFTRSLGSMDGAASFAIDPVRALRSFVAQRAGPPRPVLIPDTSINTLSRLDELAAAAGAPVVTANHASLEHGLFLAGHPGWRLNRLAWIEGGGRARA